MKKKLIILTMILGVFVVGLSIYKFRFYDTSQNYNFDYRGIENKKSDIVYSDKLDSETYSENIIVDNLLSINYSSEYDGKSIEGTAYIGEDKYLYLLDNKDSEPYRVDTIKFKTMYMNDYKYDNLYVVIYLLTEDNKLYFLELTENDVKKAHLEIIESNIVLTNFVNISYNMDSFKTRNTLFMLGENGYIYDVGSASRYTKDITSIFDTIYVYSDKTMSNIYGNMLEDKEGNYYKIKYAFYTYGDNVLIESDPIVIITEDNKLLCIYSDMSYVYELDLKVKNINFDEINPYVAGNLQVVLENGYQFDFKAFCSEYYCM